MKNQAAIIGSVRMRFRSSVEGPITVLNETSRNLLLPLAGQEWSDPVQVDLVDNSFEFVVMDDLTDEKNMNMLGWQYMEDGKVQVKATPGDAARIYDSPPNEYRVTIATGNNGILLVGTIDVEM